MLNSIVATKSANVSERQKAIKTLGLSIFAASNFYVTNCKCGCEWGIGGKESNN